MNDVARERILGNLNRALSRHRISSEPVQPLTYPVLSREERIAAVKRKQEAVKSVVHVVKKDAWTDTLKTVAGERGLPNLLYSPAASIGPAVEAALGGNPATTLVRCEGPVESYKEDLFFRTAGAVTTVKGALADSGSLLLFPDAAEPRLMSLVPPVHIAVLDADTIHDSWPAAMSAGKWAEGMPTNAILTNGPSKTADIELVLVFGVHGPKELVILILE